MRPLRVIAGYGPYNVGDILTEVTGLDRERLINMKLCEEVERDEGQAVECATVAPEECAVTRTAVPSKRKRRRRRVITG